MHSAFSSAIFRSFFPLTLLGKFFFRRPWLNLEN